MNLTQKERMLLEDQKSHEQVCIKQYQDYANRAKDPKLKQLFNTYSTQEQQHLDTINQLLNGQIPQMQNEQGQQQTEQSGQPSNIQNSQGTQNYDQEDAILCEHMLMTEKYVSSGYNTTIFEFRDPNIRQVLNHIQKEEQEHGQGIFDYMQQHGMYNPK
ncbi:spore coat protein [Defluviitalea phaphyphila]|uniref:spore coat protein n=1 Tax=Defluviitalea phaphyphila TaxID=1473580 RepID=UPI000AFA63DF|nr:spore coat protein [Defluviitalea phaphyphila]